MPKPEIKGYEYKDVCGICDNVLAGGYDPKSWSLCMKHDKNVCVFGWCPDWKVIEQEEEDEYYDEEEEE